MIKSNSSRQIAGNTIYQLIGKMISMSITMFATFIITRMYGRAGYGEFNLMQNLPALFFIISDFGFNAIAARELAKDWTKAANYFGTILTMRTILSFGLMVFCVLLLQIFPYDNALKLGIYLALFLILTQSLYATTNIIFQVKLRYDYSTIGYVAGSILVLGFVLVLSVLRVPVMWVNFSYVIGGLLTFLVNMYFVKKLGVSIRFKLDKVLAKYLLIQSLPLGLMFIFSQINFKADSILLSLQQLPAGLGLGNTESVAIYGLPYKIFEVSLVVPTFFMNAAYPILVRHMEESKERLKETITKVILFLVGLGLMGSIVGVLFAPLAINILGGADFGLSISVLRLLLVGSFVFYITQPIAWLIVTLGHQKWLPLIYLISAVFNVSANLIFIPRHSFYASAVITWLSEFIILVFLVIFARKAWKLKYAA